MRRLLLLLLLASALGTAARADGGPRIEHARARSTVQGQSVGGAYLDIDNRAGRADTLLGAKSPVAASVELHRMAMDGDVMRMRPAGPVEVPAGGTVTLAPAGLHLMLVDLAQPLRDGQTFPLTLQFAKAGAVTVQVTVESALPAGRDLKH